MDIKSPKERSDNMSRIRSADTKPEIFVRQALFAGGYRFRLHRRDLPGCPDIVLPKHRAAVFVHGCFWHRHEHCPKSRIPEDHRQYWEEKLRRNAERDREERDALLLAGWRVLWVWECALSKKALRASLGERISEWIQSESRFAEIGRDWSGI